MNIRKINVILLISGMALFMVLTGTTAVHAKTHEPQRTTNKQQQVNPIIPIITPADERDTSALDQNDCFSTEIHGSFFSPSSDDNGQYADIYATDLTNDTLTIHPWYAKIDGDGDFAKAFYICGVSSSFSLVTLVAVDDNTGTSSNPLPVAIIPF
jgi:hypothetical protein